MHTKIAGNKVWLLLLATMCVIWRLQPATATWQSQQNSNPAITQFGTPAANLQQCFEKTIFARSRSPAAVSHQAVAAVSIFSIDEALNYELNFSNGRNGTYKRATNLFTIWQPHLQGKTINLVRVETLDDTYGGATVEIIGGAISTVNIVLSIADGNRKPLFKSNIKVTMFCAP